MTPLRSLPMFIIIKSLIIMILLFHHQTSQAIMHEREMMEMGQLQQNVQQFKGQARLPKFAIPQSYNISMSVYVSNFTFLGVMEITIDIVSPTKYLVLNVADLVVEQSSIWFSGDHLGGSGKVRKHILVSYLFQNIFLYNFIKLL